MEDEHLAFLLHLTRSPSQGVQSRGKERKAECGEFESTLGSTKEGLKPGKTG